MATKKKASKGKKANGGMAITKRDQEWYMHMADGKKPKKTKR